MVSCWSVDGKNKPTSTFTNNVQHGSTITVLKWNPAGKRLVTGDKVKLFFSLFWFFRNKSTWFSLHTKNSQRLSQCPIACIWMFFFWHGSLSLCVTERSRVRVANGFSWGSEPHPPIPQERCVILLFDPSVFQLIVDDLISVWCFLFIFLYHFISKLVVLPCPTTISQVLFLRWFTACSVPAAPIMWILLLRGDPMHPTELWLCTTETPALAKVRW